MCQNYERWFGVDKVIAVKKWFLAHPITCSGATAVDSFGISIHFNWLPVFSMLALIILFYYSHGLTTPSHFHRSPYTVYPSVNFKSTRKFALFNNFNYLSQCFSTFSVKRQFCSNFDCSWNPFFWGLLRPKGPKFEAEGQGDSKPPAPAGESGGAL